MPQLKDDFDALEFNEANITLRDKLIADAIISINTNETREFRREGCLKGIELCRHLNSLADFEAVLVPRRRTEIDIMGNKKTDIESYWRHRCATAQIDFVYQHMKVACNSFGMDGVQSARAALHMQDLTLPPPQ